jgi:hypothetical protein
LIFFLIQFNFFRKIIFRSIFIFALTTLYLCINNLFAGNNCWKYFHSVLFLLML